MRNSKWKRLERRLFDNWCMGYESWILAGCFKTCELASK